MTSSLRALIVLFCCAMALLTAGAGIGRAQTRDPASPSGSNPTTSSVTEEQLFQRMNKLKGRVTQPNANLATLEQPQGRTWRGFHEGWMPWIGGVIILLMIAVLGIYYAIKGQIRLDASEKTGTTVRRFNALERFNHWMMATCFIVLGLTGLNYIFGKRILMPLLGVDPFSGWSHWAKVAHNFIAWPFMVALALMFVLWVRDNIPARYDWAWIKAGGGLFSKAQPPAGRFNAGQKMLYWSVMVFGLLMSASGLILLFPLALVDVNGMQVAQAVHAVVAVLFIAMILAHIYIGSIGMEGAINAMTSGDVDLGWARHHHRVWVDHEEHGGQLGGGAPGAPRPA